MIGDNVTLVNQIVDKYVVINHENKIVAPDNDPGYIKYMDQL